MATGASPARGHLYTASGTRGVARAATPLRQAGRPQPPGAPWHPLAPPPPSRAARLRVAAANRRQEEVGVLGGEDFILSQKSGVEEELFKGKLLGVDADVASGRFSESELQTLDHLGDAKGYHIPPQFMDQVALHITKNYLYSDTGGRHPLILGIWGHKGCGKMVRMQGKPTCLIIDDIDAGVGRFGDTQMTVNNQMVQATLMALCDDPEHVSVGQDWRDGDELPRVPIFVTGNDLSRLYAPLLRDGRMTKWYWSPTRTDIVAMVSKLFEGETDGGDVAALVGAFPGQPLDFFSAVRSRLVDGAVREWVDRTGVDRMGSALVPDGPWYRRAKVQLGPDAVHASLDDNAGAVRRAVEEVAAREAAMSEAREKAAVALSEQDQGEFVVVATETRDAGGVTGFTDADIDEKPYFAKPPAGGGGGGSCAAEEGAGLEERDGEEKDWPCVDVERARDMVDEGYVYVDVRARREFEKEKFKLATSVPSVDVTGTSLNPVVSPRDLGDVVADFEEMFPEKGTRMVVIGGAGADGGAVVGRLRAVGYVEAVEIMGGFEAWAPLFRTDGTVVEHIGTLQGEVKVLTALIELLLLEPEAKA